MKIGVTGANGFVGRHLVERLVVQGHDVTALVRTASAVVTDLPHDVVHIPDLNGKTDPGHLRAAVSGLDVIIHLAGHVHAMNAAEDDPAFHDVNVLGSQRLFEAAEAAEIKRFVFLSSVKAAGERSGNTPLSAGNSPGPEDAYGRSKRDAEKTLHALADKSDCALIILRSTFVYGWPPVGNFKSVVNAVLKGIPLPLAAINNRRHMIFVGNLADALCHTIEAPGLTDEPYFVADCDPVSTSDLFRLTGDAFSSPARLFYVPLWMLRFAGMLTGKRPMIERLTGNLDVDTGPFRRDAGWMPPYNMSEGLSMCAAEYSRSQKNRK